MTVRSAPFIKADHSFCRKNQSIGCSDSREIHVLFPVDYPCSCCRYHLFGNGVNFVPTFLTQFILNLIILMLWCKLTREMSALKHISCSSTISWQTYSLINFCLVEGITLLSLPSLSLICSLAFPFLLCDDRDPEDIDPPSFPLDPSVDLDQEETKVKRLEDAQGIDRNSTLQCVLVWHVHLLTSTAWFHLSCRMHFSLILNHSYSVSFGTVCHTLFRQPWKNLKAGQKNLRFSSLEEFYWKQTSYCTNYYMFHVYIYRHDPWLPVF